MKSKTTLFLPPLLPAPGESPARCPSCGADHIIRHGTVQRPLRDPVLKSVVVERYRCVQCGGTFRHYPSGVGRTKPSQRVVAVAALLWWFGLSCAAISRVLAGMGAVISPATVWRTVQGSGVDAAPQRRRHVRSRLLRAGETPDLESDDFAIQMLRDPEGADVVALQVWHPGAKLVPDHLRRSLRAWGSTVDQELADVPVDRPAMDSGRAGLRGRTRVGV